ncbi:MAG: ATP-dependent RecD-like DNA helicase [Oscillospiraceae bacterium]|nr:ATP-dependent RecD-like DNA helicase [Oscillospiraceae bacterium]
MNGQQPLEYLSGAVENIVFQNEESGFCVFEVASKDGGELVTAVGMIPAIAAGEEVVLTGRYGSHPTYGHQFRVELCERTLPATASAILKYLSSRAIKGIGERTARRIVDMFGNQTLEVIEKEPEKLAQIRGISLAKAQDISEDYKHIYGVRQTMLALARYGLDADTAIRVWRHWGTLATKLLEQDPYSLCCEAIGVTFDEADAIAAKLGVEPDSPMRLRAGLIYVLAHNLSNGHTCAPAKKLIPTAAAKLGCDSALLGEALEKALEDGTLVSDTVEGMWYIYLPALYEAETYVAGRIELMLKIACPEPKNYENAITALENRLDITYENAQRGAISMAMQNRVFILTGGPGTGKTTALNGLLELLEDEGEKVALAAPTGRAAKRMAEICGRDAKTIHRLLEVDFNDGSSDTIKFKRNEKNLLRFDTVILDETSMVDIRLMHSLMRAMKMNCRLILVGDPDQLPSVGAGNLLRDLIASDAIPCIHLSEIFRQAKESHIVVSSHSIVRGDMPDLSVRDRDMFFLRGEDSESVVQTVLDLCSSRLPNAYGYSPLWDIQVISPTRKGALGTMELNRRLQEKLNPPDSKLASHKFGTIILREQDKVMQVKNNYDITWQNDSGRGGTGVFNGDIGVIEMIDRPSQTILIRYDDRLATYSFDMAHEIEHAYAITVHKSQGSEFAAVVMPLGSFHPTLHYRNLLYTAVTRAKKLLIMLGRQDTVYRMVENDRKTLRYTNLAAFLRKNVLE